MSSFSVAYCGHTARHCTRASHGLVDVKPRKQIICHPRFEREIRLVRLLLNRAEGHFACACVYKICPARSASFWYFQGYSSGFQLGDRHLFVKVFGEGWKSMTSLPPFLTLWVLVESAGSSDEDILMIKVQTKRKKRPKTWSLRLDLQTIKMCTWDNKPWRLVLRCWYLTSVNHEVVCGDDREIFVTIIEGNLEFDLLLLQLWNKFALSSRWPQASSHIK